MGPGGRPGRAVRGGRGSDALNASEGPNSGVTVNVHTGIAPAPGGGQITLRGFMDLTGGDAAASAVSTIGASGGTLTLTVSSEVGTIVVEPSATIVADGGRGTQGGGIGGGVGMSVGGGIAANGTRGGQVRIGGLLRMRGGAGTASAGGRGGFLNVLSDTATVAGANDGRGADIWITAGAVVDVTGGTGTPGGMAFPQLAISLDADGINTDDSAENGRVVNQGLIVTRGAATNGAGGSVAFDGLSEFGLVGPAPGNQDRSGSGSGAAGTFTAQ